MSLSENFSPLISIYVIFYPSNIKQALSCPDVLMALMHITVCIILWPDINRWKWIVTIITWDNQRKSKIVRLPAIFLLNLSVLRKLVCHSFRKKTIQWDLFQIYTSDGVTVQFKPWFWNLLVYFTSRISVSYEIIWSAELIYLNQWFMMI